MKIELSTDFKNKILFSFICIITIGILFFIGGSFLENNEVELNYFQKIMFIFCQILIGIGNITIIFVMFLYITNFYTYLKKI